MRKTIPLARMAELVDALVSNTSGAIRAGSIPAPGTIIKSQMIVCKSFGIFVFTLHARIFGKSEILSKNCIFPHNIEKRFLESI